MLNAYYVMLTTPQLLAPTYGGEKEKEQKEGPPKFWAINRTTIPNFPNVPNKPLLLLHLPLAQRHAYQLLLPSLCRFAMSLSS
jgi:hypothetical protein